MEWLPMEWLPWEWLSRFSEPLWLDLFQLKLPLCQLGDKDSAFESQHLVRVP
jgi:hypothetical protein